MASLQDLDSRVGVLERKVDFIMSLAKVTKRTPSIVSPGDYVLEQISMLDLYNEVQSSGGVVKETTNG